MRKPSAAECRLPLAAAAVVKEQSVANSMRKLTAQPPYGKRFAVFYCSHSFRPPEVVASRDSSKPALQNSSPTEQPTDRRKGSKAKDCLCY